MIGLNGSMVTGTVTPESDIDFYVVLQKGRIFSGRFLVTVVTNLLGCRRYGDKVAGRICLNRFAVDDYLCIWDWNLYHARVFHNLIPLYASQKVYRKYVQENQWMSAFGYPVIVHRPPFTDRLWLRMWQWFWEFLLTPLFWISEPLLRRRQWARLRSDERVNQPGSRVVISDRELRFHLTKPGRNDRAEGLPKVIKNPHFC
jgi:hypothetical protein